jgi:hypothetical protein
MCGFFGDRPSSSALALLVVVHAVICDWSVADMEDL